MAAYFDTLLADSSTISRVFFILQSASPARGCPSLLFVSMVKSCTLVQSLDRQRFNNLEYIRFVENNAQNIPLV